jgi:N-acyl-D-aspartate/D-glutamate deacylase
MIGSDGFSLAADYPAAVHPRACGAFPAALRLLVDAGLPWERAIAKATGEPAAKLGLTGRGELRAGAHADVTVIDPASLAGQATYAEPLRPATGVRHVLVGGVPVLEDSRPTGARPGRVLLRA